MHKLFFTATIQELEAQTTIDVPEYIRERILAEDPNPFWALLEVGKEGTSKGDLGSYGKTSKRWTSVAIKELAKKIKSAKIFTDNHGDPESFDRKSFGEVVHGYYDTIAGKTRALAVAYIKDPQVRERIKKGDLNICSIEGIVNVVNRMGNFIVDSVNSVKGLLIAEGKRAKAGFDGAGIMLSVQELEGELEMTIKLSDVKAYIVDHNTAPKDIFTSDQLSKDDVVKGIITSAVDEQKHNAEKEIKKLEKEIEKVTEENKPFRIEAGKVKVKNMMTENPEVKAMSKEKAQAVMDFALNDLSEDIFDKTDAEIAEAVGKKLEAGINFAKSFTGEKKTEPNKGVDPTEYRGYDPYDISKD